MNPELEQLAGRFSDDFTPPWGLPSLADFESLSKQFGCSFPMSYLEYCTAYASRIPCPDDWFQWASAKGSDDAYASLEVCILDARKWGVPNYLVPFWTDEGNFYCFDMRKPTANGEFAIVFWDHESPQSENKVEFDRFTDWLIAKLNDQPFGKGQS